MNRAQKLADTLFYRRDSEEGEAKQQFIAGLSPFGRICTINLGERPRRRRVTITDLRHYSDNAERLTALSQGTPNQHLHDEFFAQVRAEGQIDSFTLFAGLMQCGLVKGGYALASSFMQESEYASLVHGCQIEVYLFHAQNQIGFVYEIFPEIEGIGTDQFYGSNMRSVTLITSFTENQMALGEDVMRHSMFGSLAFGERLRELSTNPANQDKSGDWSFDQEAEQAVQDEWFSGTSLWKIKHERFVLAFLNGFIGAFVRQHRLASSVMGLLDSPDSITGKSARIRREDL